jgi:hypothetical protein
VGLPTLNLVGLDPGAGRRYVWIGDDAVDADATDVPNWIKTGNGEVLKEGASPTVFQTRALSPTMLELVLNHARLRPKDEPGPRTVLSIELLERNWPAAERAAVAYGVVSIENGPEVKRVQDAGGLRLSDATLDALDHPQLTIMGLRLLSHLGNLILSDSRPSETESKP